MSTYGLCAEGSACVTPEFSRQPVAQVKGQRRELSAQHMAQPPWGPGRPSPELALLTTPLPLQTTQCVYT